MLQRLQDLVGSAMRPLRERGGFGCLGVLGMGVIGTVEEGSLLVIGITI